MLNGILSGILRLSKTNDVLPDSEIKDCTHALHCTSTTAT